MTNQDYMKNWSELNLKEGKAYRIKIFKSEDERGYELLVIDETIGTYDVIDADRLRKKLIEARDTYKELLEEKFPNVTIKIDKSRA